MKLLTTLLALLAIPLAAEPTAISCGNLVYGKNQTSVCFASTFLKDAAQATGLEIDPEFKRIKLGADEIFTTPMCIFTGEGEFTLNEAERKNLKQYVMNGGFIIVSPGCSDEKWNAAFKRELAAVFPGHPLEPLSMDHELFSMVHTITELDAGSRVGHIKLQGITVNGRLAILYSPEGLNNARNAKGCCCCGGNELRNSREINVNALVYALIY
ncbi:DUF4159 domain-containing protein [Roseibacillus persicicus]|uniref:DUF4159 domain-containing protein n=1 Tax=Roseibacillus persicicus TaxID=454148 RepID=A0A918TCI0_9BACT|nr:DUF4159 domain-containing protein [Roseibacillus persicicus]GHC40633.1 hypothetical protein GCM10007100_01430 [Roseibacillus persicicus]